MSKFIAPRNCVIVTRHKGALQWLCGQLECENDARWSVHFDGDTPVFLDLVGFETGYTPGIGEEPTLLDRIVVYAGVVNRRDIQSLDVIGNLPLHLAVYAASVTAIEFSGAPPRGAEYTAEEMVIAGACLSRYRVQRYKRGDEV